MRFAAALSGRAIARSLHVSPSTVEDYVRHAEVGGLGWPVPESVDDAALERRLFPTPPPSGTSRLYAALVGSYAAVALFLALFGIYGQLSRAAAERRGEIGIRMAMGARRGAVVVVVVRRSAGVVVAGLAVGTLGALAATRLLESFLFGVAPNDFASYAAAALAVALVTVAACWLPARRAARVNPMDALRMG